tara:strand:- start:2565 stop:2681 length:117 start_codon:yes stop_codon:yes gene_type:complete
MISVANQILSSIPPDHMPLVEFFGMMTIGITAGSLGVI